MSTKCEAYLLYVQCDSCVCAQPTAVWFQRQNGVFPKAKDICISVFLLWGQVYGRAKQLCDLTIGLHCPIPAALTVFPLGLIQLSFYSVKGFPWVQGELDQERQSQFISWDLTCLYSNLKGSEFTGKAPCDSRGLWNRCRLKQITTWATCDSKHPFLVHAWMRGTEYITSGFSF